MKKIIEPEEFLKKLSLQSPPEALKKRILDAVECEQKEYLYLRPVFWKVVLFSGILSLIIFFLDIRINSIQNNNLTSKYGILHVHEREKNNIQKELMEEIFNGVLKGKNLPLIKRYMIPEDQKDKQKNNLKLHLFFKEEFYEE